MRSRNRPTDPIPTASLCTGYYNFDPNTFTEDADAFPSILGRFATTTRTICCGPAHQQHGSRRFSRTFRISENKHIEFRAEFFNIFNHTQFFNPDGNSSDGSQFGQVTADP